MKTKISVHSFYAWNFESEAEWLDRMSEKGWQLRRGGCFRSKYYRDETVRYRHQLDYRAGKDIDNMSRYIEAFQDQGWEYVNSLRSGWHYFRKPYDPALPEEEYRIYTDTESVADMKRRWTKIVTVLMAFILLLSALRLVDLIRGPNIPDAVYTAMFLMESAIFIRGYTIMRCNGKSRHRSIISEPVLLVVVLIAGFLLSFELEDRRPVTHMETSADYFAPIAADLREAQCMAELEVQYRDSYYLSLEGCVENPMTLTVVSDEGRVIFEKRLEAGDGLQKIIDKERLHLSRGIYSVYLSDFDGGAEQLIMDVK